VTVLVSCAAENSERWYREVYNLVLSLRRFGGGLRDAPFVACFVDAVEPRYVAGLAALGADVEVVARFDPRNPPSNKLRMLELVEKHDFEMLVALDTDTIVLGDIAGYASGDAVAARPEHADPLGPQVWRRLYRELGLAEPSRSMVTIESGRMSHPYFNTGVLFVPRRWCGDLREAWAKRVDDVLGLYERRPDIVPLAEQHWTNQLAFALAVTADAIPYTELPVAANLSTTVRVHRLFAQELRPPFVLHYHNEIDSRGFVCRSRTRQVNSLIDAFNRERAAALDLTYARLPRPPLARRFLRRVEGYGWYEGGPVYRVRKHPLLAPVRRAAMRLSKGKLV
jgi:hypothetical protein